MAALDLSQKRTTVPDVTYKSDVLEDLSVVFRLPPILYRIMSHLPMKRLNTCGSVCRSWNYTAKQLKKKRHQLSWILWNDDRLPVKDVLLKLEDHFKIMSSQPKVAFLFSTTKLFSHKYFFGKIHQTDPSNDSFSEIINSFLPEDCLLVGTSTLGIVGTHSQNGCILEIEEAYGMSCFLLPRLEGVEFHSFLIKGPGEDINTKDFPYDFLGIPSSHKIKCLLFFCGDSGPLDSQHLLTLWENQKGHFALGGGFVDYLIGPNMLKKEDQTEESILGISISGDSVEAASIIIPANVRKPEQVEVEIKKLKNYKLSEENSFAFMFACVGRGHHLYKKRNVEADAFKKLFPNTPLFGFFGNGEIGINTALDECDSYTLDSNKAKNRRKLHTPEIFHSNTTIFCLISVKK